MTLSKTIKFAGAAALLGIVTTSGTAFAQRDPAYAAARANGVVGEKADGYLGFVNSPSPAIKAMVDDLNIKRKAAYTKGAQQNNATVEQFAFTSGCRLIARTSPGEKYQTPDGKWLTRTSDDPVRDPRCP